MPARARGLPYAERFRPLRLDDLVGNGRARSELRSWALRWNDAAPPARRAAVLSGPPGVGKTSAALALAADMGWTAVEMNASDARNESAIDLVAGRASITHTLAGEFTEGRRSHALILLDEADCLTGRLTESARAAPPPAPLREFLQARYRAIEALNAAWGLGTVPKTKPFAAWDDLPRSPGRAAWSRLPAAMADLADWKSADRPRDLSDRGGLGAIARLVRTTRQPLVITVNDDRTLTRYSPVFRTGVERIRFYPVRDAEIRGRLDGIARSEGLRLQEGALDAIVRRARGDLRAALNDLDAIGPLPPGPTQLSVLGTRDLTSDLARLTEEVVGSARFYRAGEIRDRLDATPDDLLPWIEENLPRFAPDAAHRDAAFRTLAVAEMMLARARRWRVFALWSYASELQTGGVSLALHDAPVPVGAGAAFPQFLGDMGRSRANRALRDSVAGKIAQRLHLSLRKSRAGELPFLEAIFRQARGAKTGGEARPLARALARELRLSAEEVAFLLAVETEAPSVAELLAEEPEPAAPAARDERPAAGRRGAQRSLAEFGGR